MSDVSVDIIKNRNGEAPDLPSGANLSGVSTAATLQSTNLNPTHINASGVTTATTFSGSLKSTGTPTLGLGVTINSSGLNISGVATAGIVSATTLYGDGSNLTGVAFSIAPMSYNPDVSDSTVPKASGIGLTFTERVIAGSGNVTLRIAGAAGTVVENFGVGSSVTISNNNVNIDPTSDLTAGETYHISYPSGAFKNTAGDLDYVGTAYTFGVKPEFISIWSWGGGTADVGTNAGNNTNTRYSSPVQLPGFVSNGAFSRHDSNLILGKSDNTLWAFGSKNDKGQLGLNNNTQYSSPVEIGGTGWNRVSTAHKNVIATKTDGTLWAWGYGIGGALAQNNETNYSSPVQVPGTTWKTGMADFASTSYGAIAIKTDGTLWTWGVNNKGQLGQNVNSPSWGGTSSPIQIPGTTWNKIGSGSGRYRLVTKTDGTLWGWGSNTYGNLGLNNRTVYSSPTQIPGTTWAYAVGGHWHSLAVKTDGTLWAWGLNSNGRLGINNATYQSSPAQVGSDTTWKTSPGGLFATTVSYAIKTDGTLWAWGQNDVGQAGINNTTVYSSPIQIPGTNWTSLTNEESGHSNYAASASQTS